MMLSGYRQKTSLFLSTQQSGRCVNMPLNYRSDVFSNYLKLASSASNDPVLHFVLFVPSASRRPLHILDNTGMNI